MRSAWECRCRSAGELNAALEAVYPLGVVHTAQAEAGTLRVVPLDDVLARQTGRYRVSAGFSAEGRALAARVICECCARVPLWNGAASRPGGIACPEACSVLVSFCREAAAWEKDPPAPAAPDRAVGFADFETPGNELREAYLAARYAVTRGQQGS
jgi:hypothetical protein